MDGCDTGMGLSSFEEGYRKGGITDFDIVAVIDSAGSEEAYSVFGFNVLSQRGQLLVSAEAVIGPKTLWYRALQE
jgi:hypothetical protein